MPENFLETKNMMKTRIIDHIQPPCGISTAIGKESCNRCPFLEGDECLLKIYFLEMRG